MAEKQADAVTEKRSAMYEALRVVANIVFHTVMPVRIHNRERLDHTPPYIMIANHNHALDPVAMAMIRSYAKIGYPMVELSPGNQRIEHTFASYTPENRMTVTVDDCQAAIRYDEDSVRILNMAMSEIRNNGLTPPEVSFTFESKGNILNPCVLRIRVKGRTIEPSEWQSFFGTLMDQCNDLIACQDTLIRTLNILLSLLHIGLRVKDDVFIAAEASKASKSNDSEDDDRRYVDQTFYN